MPQPRSAIPRARIADLLFGLILLLTVVFSLLLAASVRAQQQARFEREADIYASALRERLSAYLDVLRSARALWYTSDRVTPGDFRRFVNSVGIGERYPGISRLGYGRWVTQAQLAGYVQEQQALRSGPFTVQPPGARPVYVPVTYLEPVAGAENVLGYDMYSEPARRAALDQAAASGEAAVTDGVTLRNGTTSGGQRQGFLMYLPIYADSHTPATPQARRAALSGFLYASVATERFLAGAYPAFRSGQLQVRISDGAALLYGASLPDGFRRSTHIDVAGRRWQLTFAAPASFARDSGQVLPWLTGLVGLLLALTARRVAQNQERMRQQAEQTSERLAASRASLDRARAEFEAVFRSMPDAALFSDPQGVVRLANPAAERSFGVQPGELLGRRLAALSLQVEPDGLLHYRRVGGPGERQDFLAELRHSEVYDELGTALGGLDLIRDVTERVEAERARSESQLRYQGVLEAMPQMVWVANPEGRTQYYNAGWYSYTGLSEEASLGYGFTAALHPDDVERALAAWERCWQQGEPYELEYRIRRHDGVYHTFVGRASAVRGEGGAVIEWVGTCTDIQARIEQDLLLRRSEARSRRLLESLPQIVWVLDAEGRTTFVNERWASAVAPEFRNTPQEAIEPQDNAHLQTVWAWARRHGEPFSVEYRLLGPEGRYRSFLARGLPLRDEAGAVREWIVSSTDVDDQVYAENSARLLAEFSRVLSARLADGTPGELRGALKLLTGPFAASVLLVQPQPQGPQLTLVAVDEAELALQQTVIGRYGQDIQQLAEAVMASGQEQLAGEDTAVLGELGLRGVLAQPVLTRGGSVLAALILGYRQSVLTRDLDFAREAAARLGTALENEQLLAQSRAAQQQLAELNQTLEARVQARTVELEDTNRELEAFSYSVSHDLRTPLRHVVGFADLLRKESAGKLDGKGERYLNIITDAARRMSTLIDDLLDFSRMGRQPLRLREVDLGELFSQARADLEPEGVERAQAVVWDIGPLPVVRGDAALLKLAITNLLTNALKYSRDRETSVITVRGELEGGEARVTVTDNGVGFDSRFGERLFGVFQRLHRQEEFEGTGIGLANVRRIVTRHGGRVWAESELGRGATFGFSLPLVGVASEAPSHSGTPPR